MTAEDLFKDAEFLYQEALKELDRGKIRNAAEKAWGATVGATNAFILARTGKKPQTPVGTRKALHELALENPEVDKTLVDRFHTRRDYLHGDCFYDGICEPKEDIERRIRETSSYIEDAKRLANKGRQNKSSDGGKMWS